MNNSKNFKEDENDDINLIKEALNKLLDLKNSGQPDQDVVNGLKEWIKNQANKDIETIFKLVELHHASNPEFLYLLGYLTNYGLGTDENPVAAFKYYYKVAERGLNYGQARIAWCFYKGLGVKVDHVKAFEWYQKAAENNHLCSQFNLGLFYSQGIGTKKNLEMGFKWVQVAANHGDLLAQFELAKMYLSGNGTKKDYRKANYWLWKTADTRVLHLKEDCLFNLASISANGMGIKRDFHQALRLYRRVLILNNGYSWGFKSTLQSLFEPQEWIL
ncbi:8911_t:CDS:2 [Ambispora leptoticha]|uniref:8911_t:CDS:1 n=1 Tax=Ambispora leptoticha TaxID=144679 RepID=A0A9N9GE35_9GLOM|nr:8911_t:CDS:2 [Ambispora leptoticha]